MANAISGYKKKPRESKSVAVVFRCSETDLIRLDEWGISAGMESRTQAVLCVLRKGLDVLEKKREAQ